MKALYTLLFVIFIQACLNSSDPYVISIDDQNQLTIVDCTDQQYGFAFLAQTSGFTGEATLRFYLDSPYYNLFTCTVPPSKEGEYSTIECYADSNIFPIFEDTTLPLPDDPKVSGVSFEGWNLLKIKPLTFTKCTQLTPTSTFNSKEEFTLDCDNSGNNVISTTGSFSTSFKDKKIFLTSTDEDYTTYSFKPYLLVDGKIAQALCYIYVLNGENGGDDQLSCHVNGQKNGIFFDTAATLELVEGSEAEVVRMKPSQPFSLKVCKSSFMKLSAFILISLFLL